MVRLMIRAVGAARVVAGAAGLGTFFSSRLLLRLRLLEDLRKLVFLLKGEILYGNSSLEEAFARAGGRLDGRIGRFAEMVAEGIGERQGRGFQEIWKAEMESLADLPLDREDREQLESFGGQLGYLDRQMQERTMLLYLEQLELAIGGLRERKREACRLYTGLSLAGGLFFVIIMC